MEKNYLQDEDLSIRAKGLLTIMLNVPFRSMKELSLISKDGRVSIRTALNELEENGYITRENQRAERGYFNVNYSAFEYSQLK